MPSVQRKTDEKFEISSDSPEKYTPKNKQKRMEPGHSPLLQSKGTPLGTKSWGQPQEENPFVIDGTLREKEPSNSQLVLHREQENEHQLGVLARESLPLAVLRCRSCKENIGNTTELHSVDHKLKRIILNTVDTNSIERDSKPSISKEDPDFGCAYCAIRCTYCKEQLGRIYLTTTKELDLYREKYLLDVKAIYYSEINISLKSTPRKSPEKDRAEAQPIPQAQDRDILRLKTVVTALYEKIVFLEERLAKLEGNK